MTPHHRVVGAWVLLVVSLIAWPASQLTIAGDEPPFTLGLSFLAIILTALDVLLTAGVEKRQDDDG